MCGHCGCQGVDAIGELRDEHAALLDDVHAVRRALAAGDRDRAGAALAVLAGHLAPHVTREERGIFAALRAQDDVIDEVEALEAEHLALDAAVRALDPAAVDFEARVAGLLEELEHHIEREDLGVFPFSVVTLGAAGWDLVDRAHRDVPSFLTRTR